MHKETEANKEHLDWLRERTTPINESNICWQKVNWGLSSKNKLWTESNSSRIVLNDFKPLQGTEFESDKSRNIEECRSLTYLITCCLKGLEQIKN
jgi:hypothetical protein